MSSPTLSGSPLATERASLVVWMDGHLYDDPAEARVAAVDHGLVVGNGVFEALKVTEAGPYAIGRHLARMSRSAAALGLPDPDHRVVREAIEAVVAGRDYPYGKVRVTYTGGAGPLGSYPAEGPPTLVVAAEAATRPSATIKLVTVPWTRNERGALAGVKSTSYAENVRALAYALDRRAGESILLNSRGAVCEGTGSNLFCVFGDEIVTPPLSSGPLAGITRELLLEWLPITERDLTLAQAQAADEVFVTSSLRDVQPVEAWDDVSFAAPGQVTARVVEAFAARSHDLDP